MHQVQYKKKTTLTLEDAPQALQHDSTTGIEQTSQETVEGDAQQGRYPRRSTFLYYIKAIFLSGWV